MIGAMSCLLLLVVGFVSASMYNNVVSDEKLASLREVGVSLSITPLWSAEFQDQDGGSIIISFLDVKEITSDSKVTWESNWYYLSKDGDEYIADDSTIYANYSAYVSDENHDASKITISKITLDFDSQKSYSSSSVVDISKRELSEDLIPQFELDFDSQIGKLSKALYEGASMELVKESGSMTYGFYMTESVDE